MARVPYGISNFESIRDKEKNYLYVDKTRFLHEVEEINHIIHLRPRRFGKSLFLSMMDCYYDVASADKFDELFRGLYVYDHPTPYRNRYYVLRFNFSGIQNAETDDLKNGFLEKVKTGVQRFIDRYELDIKLRESNSSAVVLNALLNGFEALKLPNKIYILIDEYDHFTNSVLSGDGEAFLKVLKRGGFVRSFYEIIKEYTELGAVERIFITGVMSVTLDSMTSGFNISTNVSTRARFADIMGFTADEVNQVLALPFTTAKSSEQIVTLSEDERAEIFDVFKENYNGYIFSTKSNLKIFNSTLIMYYLSHYIKEGQAPESFVDLNLNQSDSTIENIVELKMPEQNYELIREIIENKEVAGELEPFIDITKKFDQDDVITMLYSIGILTIKSAGFGVVFEIPNKVIQRIYLHYLSNLMQRKAEYRIDMRKQRLAFRELGTSGRVDKLTKIVEDFLMHVSNRNLIDLDEKHVKLMYFILTHATEDFIVYDEFPVGNGYADIFIQKTLTSKAKYEAFIELKYLKRNATTEASIEGKLNEGIAQIESYMKDEGLTNRPGMKKYVIVFSGYEVVKVEEI